MTGQRNIGTTLLGISIGFLILLYVLPISNLALLSLAEGGRAYREFFAMEASIPILVNTFLFSAEVTFFSLVLGYPVACVALTASPRWRAVILLISTVPLWTSLLVRTYAWLALLGRNGVINQTLQSVGLIDSPLDLSRNSFGAMVSSVYIMLPLMVLTLYAAMRQIDMNTIKAARTLGARRSQAFLAVFVPLSKPGIVSACLLVFIISLGFFVTPALLGGPSDRTFSMLIAQQINRLADFAAASAQSIFFLGISIAMLLVFAGTIGFDQFIGGRLRQQGRSWLAASPLVDHLPLLAPLLRILESRLLWNLVVGLVLLWLLSPFLVIIQLSLSAADYLQFPVQEWSLRWYEELVATRQWRAAGLNSLVVAAIASALALGIGLTAALGLREVRGSVGRFALVILLAPALLPSMIYSIGAYLAAAKLGWADSRTALALAHSTLGLPFVIIILTTALGSLDPNLERAARSLGAGRWASLRFVTVPLLLPALISAAIIAFQTSFDEVVVSLFLSGVRTRTIPRLMWQSATMEVDPAVMAVAVVVLATVLIAALLGYLVVRLVPGMRRQAAAR
ncbi:MAG: ABC transporter permease subunit [Dongiaceae bacterium]